MIIFFMKGRVGFSLVEVLLALAVFAVIATFVVVAFSYGEESTVLSGSSARATSLASEGLDAIENLRDEDFASVPDGTRPFFVWWRMDTFRD